jgi:hypothetical protein
VSSEREGALCYNPRQKMCGTNSILRIDSTAATVDVDEALRTRERMR